MLRKTFRFILRFGFFILVLLVIIVGGLALLALVGPERAIDFKKLLDAGWWFTSVIRWAVIAGIIVYLPKFAARRVEKYSQELEGWVDAYDEAEAKGATYHRLAGCLLICIEIIFVQFPHLI